MMMNNLIVLEYSATQKAFNRLELGELFIRNAASIINNKPQPDYLVVGVYTDNDSCDAAFKRIEPILRPNNTSEVILPAVDNILLTKSYLN